ncbi:AraC family transcriptional regulator [Microvirga roseola]|uniref:AraC family transcriptional regulator n=1 Tax=Microvirga roseola TaxID=2883126 RepID=UPI001E5F1044|nr:AraC family transcriptional regulator [Microvirga roseola]
MTAPARTHYHARFRRVLDHIDENLSGDLSLDVLSSVAAFSRYHFHRQFSALLGISLHRYVQLARLRRASYKLAFRGEEPILQIVLDSGYEGPEAFSRAFKQRFGQTPSDFRDQPRWTSWHEAYQPFSQTRKVHMARTWSNEQVGVREVGDLRVAALEHRGDPSAIGDSVRRFIGWRKEAGLSPKHSATLNILYDDPDTTPAEDFRLVLCAETDRDVAPNGAGIIAKTIPGGRCAVLRHTGPESSLGEAIAYLYSVWLPESGEEARDFPLYCQRIEFFPDVPEHRAVTDIFLPLR